MNLGLATNSTDSENFRMRQESSIFFYLLRATELILMMFISHQYLKSRNANTVCALQNVVGFFYLVLRVSPPPVKRGLQSPLKPNR